VSRAIVSAPWWRSAVVYQIYPRSFLDTDGDGVGDLEGVRRKLDHLAWLGVDAVWLSPIFPSPMEDFGYDVSDYCDVDPLFGSLAGFDRLLAEAHARGLRVLLDWVPNHTSDRHRWFVESRRSRTSPKRDWYVWRDPAPDGGPPNNWVAAFPPDTRAWSLDSASGQYWLHCFLPSQPDLNWSNPAVASAMHDVLRFWLDRGVDGFRVDVAHCLGKDPALPDDPPGLAGLPHAVLNDVPATHEILRGIRRVVDAYPGDRVLVGEIFQLVLPDATSYYGRNDELHLVFDLPRGLHTPWEAGAWRERVTAAMAAHAAAGAWPTLVLSNHDTPRHRTRLGSEARARAAAVLLLTLPGTPFLYAGDELGLEDAVVPRERRVDPGGRDGCRAPIPWEEPPGHGWPAEPWLPWPPEAAARAVAVQRDDPGSILHLYRRVLAARRASPALQLGDWTPREAPAGVLAYERVAGADRRVVLVNFTGEAVAVPASGRVVVATDAVVTGPFDGRLGPDSAVILAG
jgi:alpha-glucosidase